MTRAEYRSGLFTADYRLQARAERQESRTAAKAIWENGMALLKSIWVEERKTLAAIWSAPDAEEFAAKIKQVTPAADAKLVEETIKAFEGDESLVKRVAETVQFNRQAKRELAEQASKL